MADSTTKTATMERADFWEFKGRCAMLDLELSKLRVTLATIGEQRNALVDAFAQKHGFDPAKPIVLDDEALTASQPPVASSS